MMEQKEKEKRVLRSNDANRGAFIDKELHMEDVPGFKEMRRIKHSTSLHLLSLVEPYKQRKPTKE